MEAHTTKLQNLNITSDETGDDAKVLQHHHATSDVETEHNAIFERDYIVDDDDDYDEDEDEDDDDDDDDYDEDGEDLEPRVTLGVLREKPQDLQFFLPQHFPTKAGGAPLDPVNLPSGKSSCCDFCGDPLRFVLQLYAPHEWKGTDYHRMFFVFMCPSMSCLQLDQHEQGKDRAANPRRSVKVFRCQLPKDNEFYAAEEPKGCVGSQCSGGENFCSHCGNTRYCSRKHQELHWRAGHENDLCRIPSSPDGSILPGAGKVFPGHRWPQYLVVGKTEPSSSSSSGDDKSELMGVQGQVEPDVMMQAFMDHFEADEDNTCWASFLDRISRERSQVLRYCREEDAEPLWAVSSGSLSEADIPSCIYCNGPLGFEFQIMPQLRHYFHVENEPDPLDWATIIVYTCRDSCDGSVSYKEEFVRVQFSPWPAGL
ncbi:hypothetical protein ACQ4PT_030050 [Festuca glaucescens]